MEGDGVPAKGSILASVLNQKAKVSSLIKNFSGSITGSLWGLKSYVTSRGGRPGEVHSGVNTQMDNFSEEKVMGRVAPEEGEKVVVPVAPEEGEKVVVPVAPEEAVKVVVQVAREEGEKVMGQVAPKEVKLPLEEVDKVVVPVAPEEGEIVVGQVASKEVKVPPNEGEKVMVQAAPEKGDKMVARMAPEEGEKVMGLVAPEEGEKLVVPVAPEEGEKVVGQVASKEVQVPPDEGVKVVVQVAPDKGEKVVVPVAPEKGEKVVVQVAPVEGEEVMGQVAPKEVHVPPGKGDKVVVLVAPEEGGKVVGQVAFQEVQVPSDEGEKVVVPSAPVAAKKSILVRVWNKIYEASTWVKAKMKSALKRFSVSMTDTLLGLRSFVTSCPEKVREVLPGINTQIDNLSEKKLVEVQGVPEEGSLLHDMKMLVQNVRKLVEQWLVADGSLEMKVEGLKLKRSLDLVDGFIELFEYHKQPARFIMFLLFNGYFIYRSSNKAGGAELVSEHKAKASRALGTLATLVLSASRLECG